MSTRFISRRYARALFELIQEGAGLQDGLEALAAVAADADAAAVLASPSVSVDDKVALLTGTAAKILKSGKPGKELEALVRMLCERGKATLLPEIAELVAEMVLQSQSELVADVTTATKLDASMQKKIAEALSRSVGRDVRLQISEDKSLIGGLVVQIGDRQIDCSVRNRLQGLRKAIAG